MARATGSTQTESRDIQRRGILVLCERIYELLLHSFGLITDVDCEAWTTEPAPGPLRRQGKAEGHIGELK